MDVQHLDPTDALIVRLEDTLLLATTSAGALAREIETRLLAGTCPSLKFCSPGYADSRRELDSRKDHSERQRRQLLEQTQPLDIFDRDRDQVIGEAIGLLIEHLYPQLRLTANPQNATAVLFSLVEIFSPGGRSIQQTTKFDVFRKDVPWSFGIYLRADQVAEITERQRTHVSRLTGDLGLTVQDLPTLAVCQQLAPAMIRYFMSLKYRHKTPADVSRYFELSAWSVGLG